MKAYLAIKFKEDGSNRSLIEELSASLEKSGIETTVFYREYEKWGEVTFTPKELMRLVHEITDVSDAVIIEFSEKGVGLGIEAGYARAKGIPVHVIAKTGSEISDTLRGIAESITFYDTPENLDVSAMRPKESIGNIAFIDGQNLHLGTKESGWSVDHKRLRVYLRDKYHITEAYYFLGFICEGHQELYDGLQRAGFILSFREHSSALRGNKKGNVDSDIVFGIMKKLVENESFGTIFIVSGDGDYKKLVDFLIKKNRFGKMLFPNRAFASSLYKSLGGEFFAYLEDIQAKIAYAHK